MNIKIKSQAEEMWDKRADSFNEYQKNNKSKVEDIVLNKVEELYTLGNLNLLDIGGGSGRYAIPLAKKAKKLVMTDISGKMIEHAQNNSKEQGIDNISFEKIDWENMDIEESGLKDRFDLVFASMCPAIKSDKGFENMLLASKGHGFIVQYILDKDSLYEFIDKELGIKRGFNPHNDRDSVKRFFNILWDRKYNPQIDYAVEEDSKVFKLDDIMKNINRDYGELAKEKNIDLEVLVKKYDKYRNQDEIIVDIKTIAAMISF